VTDFQTDSALATDASSDASVDQPSTAHDLPLDVPSITNSPRCAPSHCAPPHSAPSHSAPPQPAKPGAPRRVRTVRVDAWAVPASANWSRARTPIRKVSRTTRSTDWALPF
jgi:hypothetical protein